MKTSVMTGKREKSGEVLVLFSYEDGATPIFTRTDKELKGELSALKKSKDFLGKISSIAAVRQQGRKIILVGLGKKKELTIELLRRAAGLGAKSARQLGEKGVFALPPTSFKSEDVARAITEGALLALYQFLKYKTQNLEEFKKLTSFTLLVEKSDVGIKRGMDDAVILTRGVMCARDMVNIPAMDMNPASMESAARKLAKQQSISCKVFQMSELKKRKMGAIVGVGQGSVIPPRMIILEYKRPGAKKHFVFCGKGVCYDSGGYNLKTRMLESMKDDMGGAAALLGMLEVLAARKTKAHVTVIIGAVENLISGSAYKAGDVVKAMNGKTIEVANTDAEGRVVLADCLSYASTIKGASMIIDIATLTGSAMSALGTLAGAICSPNKQLVEQFHAAGESSGDRVWEIPMWDDFKEDVKSEIADVKNLGFSFYAGVTAGAVFLQEFVKDPKNWLHIDMGGTVMEERDRAYIQKGATGWGVRLLTTFVENS